MRSLRWVAFSCFVLALPLPFLGPWQGLVPPVRHALLLAATAAVALGEGAAGPVPGILALFAVHLVLGLLLAWGLAWALVRGLASLAPGLRRWVVWGLCGGLVALALASDLYVTPFGRAPTSDLVGVLS